MAKIPTPSVGQGLHGLFATFRSQSLLLFFSVTLFAMPPHSGTLQSSFRFAPLRLQRATPPHKGKKPLHSNHHHRSACARKTTTPSYFT
jgi:hypothetical protein